MRNITDHQINALNRAIDVKVINEPTSGSADWNYLLKIPVGPPSPCVLMSTQNDGERIYASFKYLNLAFQHGDPAVEANGLTNEALLAVMIDRLRGFQSGPFAGRENTIALTKLEEALLWLEKRTREREARGVEGTQTV
jgi:hypothetical protein